MNRKIKWIFTFLAIAVFLIFGGMLGGEPLVNRAMVVGFGIDLSENGDLEISAQILQSGNGSESSAMNSRVVKANHRTIAGAMSGISEKAGLTVALTHCNVVVLGRNIAESTDVYSVTNYLITNNYLSENAFLFVADGKASDLLNSNTGFGGNASLYIQKLVGKYGEYNDIGSRTLQDFVVDYHRLGQANWLPIIKKEEAEPEIAESSSAGAEQTDYIFTFNSLMLFEKNKKVAEYGAEGTSALNYVKNKVKKGVIEGEGDDGEKIVMYILDKKNKMNFDLENKKVSVEISFDAILKEIIDYSDEDRFVDRMKVTAEEVTRAEEKIKKLIDDFYAETQSKNLDIFGLYEGFHSKYGKKIDGLNISDITLETKVKLEVRDL